MKWVKLVYSMFAVSVQRLNQNDGRNVTSEMYLTLKYTVGRMTCLFEWIGWACSVQRCCKVNWYVLISENLVSRHSVCGFLLDRKESVKVVSKSALLSCAVWLGGNIKKLSKYSHFFLSWRCLRWPWVLEDLQVMKEDFPSIGKSSGTQRKFA